MKKILIIVITLLININCFAQWANLANNQEVSIANLENAISTGVFNQIGQIYETPTNREIRKDSVLKWVSVDKTNANISAKINNEIIAKQDLTAIVPTACASAQTLTYAGTNYLNVGTQNYTINITITNTNAASAESYFNIYYNNQVIENFTTYTTTDTVVSVPYVYNANVGSCIGVNFYNFGSGETEPTFTANAACYAPATYYVWVYWDQGSTSIIAEVRDAPNGAGNIINIPCEEDLTVTYNETGGGTTTAPINVLAGTSGNSYDGAALFSSIASVSGSISTCNGVPITIQHQ